jgi:hypothetical protein
MRHVSDLGAGDCRVYEDGLPQSIKHFGHEDVPVSAGLLVDHSGSMRRTDRDEWSLVATMK